jgi:YD repeat-containing protein
MGRRITFTLIYVTNNTYDLLGRLVAAAHGGAIKRYRYDELGNRVSSWQNGETVTHSYNKRNQLVRTQEGEAVREYRYDGRGNLTGISENGQLKQRFEFDATNMMAR